MYQLATARGRCRLTSAGAVVAVVVLLLTGCGSSATSGGQKKTSGGSGSNAVLYNLEPVIFPYVAANNVGINSRAKELGLKFDYANANGTTDTQISQINTAIAAHAKGIIIQATDSVGVRPAIQRAINAGICVVVGQVSIGNVSGSVYPGTKGYVGWNETNSGQYAGLALAKAIGGAGEVAIEVGSLTSTSEKDHDAGAEAEWAKYPGIKLVSVTQNQYDPNTALADAKALMSRYGSHLKGIFVGQNPSAVAVINAIDASPYRGKIAVVSIGGEKQYQALVSSGKAAADVPQVPVSEGQAEVDLMKQCLDGNKKPVQVLEENLPVLRPLAPYDYTITTTNSKKVNFQSQW